MQSDISYGDFACIYDLLTDDVLYADRVNYVEKLISKHLERNPELICDLGCGTGTVCSMLSQKGYDLIGIDSSHSMLSVASQKNTDNRILLLNQDITNFELYGTVDVFLSMLDTVNYITDISDLGKTFKLVSNYLNPDGIFIFDINTKYKFENILGHNTYVYEKDNVFYTWENYYEDSILDFTLNFFVKKDKDGDYKRFSEYHTQRYYSPDEIVEIAKRQNLSLEGIYSELTFDAPALDDERIFVVLKKR